MNDLVRNYLADPSNENFNKALDEIQTWDKDDEEALRWKREDYSASYAEFEIVSELVEQSPTTRNKADGWDTYWKMQELEKALDNLYDIRMSAYAGMEQRGEEIPKNDVLSDDGLPFDESVRKFFED